MYNSAIAVVIAATLLAGCGSDYMSKAAFDLPGGDDEITRTETEARFSGELFRHRNGVVEFVHPSYTVEERMELPGFQGVVARRARTSGPLTLRTSDLPPGFSPVGPRLSR